MIRIELNFRNLLLLFALIVVAWVTYLVRDTIVLLGLALMLMATLHPLVQLAERRGLSHGWAVAAVMLALVLVPLAIVAALAPLVIAEVRGIANNFPTEQQHIQKLLRELGIADRVNQAIDRINIQDRLGNLAVVSVTQTITIAAKAFSVVVIAGYLLSDSRRLQLMLHEFVPRRSERHIEPLLEGLERVVGGYIRGQLFTSALFGVFAYILCLALGVPDPLLMGIVAAVGDIIPFFGVPLAMLVTMVVGFTVSVFQPIGIVVGYIVYGQLESHFLAPRIYSRAVNMSPLLVIVATIVGGALDGLIGVFIGIPVAGALKVVLDYIVAERVRGRDASRAAMEDEPSDLVGEQQTAEEHGRAATAAAAGGPPADGVPEPTLSPFESVPEPEPEVEEVSGARYLTLAKTRPRARAGAGVVHIHRRRRRAPDTAKRNSGAPARPDNEPEQAKKPTAEAPPSNHAARNGSFAGEPDGPAAGQRGVTKGSADLR